MITTRFREVVWTGGICAAALSFYMVSQTVAAKRAELASVERKIAATGEDIRELQQRLSLTVAYVTHDQEEALAVSDEIIVMNNARIAQRGTPHTLYAEPADLFIVDFIGDANITDVVIETVKDGKAKIQLGPLRFSLPARGLQQGPAKLAIRPDAITLSTERGLTSGVVSKAFFLGRLWEYTIETEFGALFVTIPGRAAPFVIGSSVMLDFDASGMVLVPNA